MVIRPLVSFEKTPGGTIFVVLVNRSKGGKIAPSQREWGREFNYYSGAAQNTVKDVTGNANKTVGRKAEVLEGGETPTRKDHSSNWGVKSSKKKLC